MKTSNKIILLTVSIIFGSLILYNFKLKALYESKSYRGRFYDMDYVAIAGIRAIDLQSANHISIQIEYGTKEGLWVAKALKDKIKLIAVGDSLKLGFADETKAPNNKDVFLILITKDMKRIVATHTDPKRDAAVSASKMRLKGFNLSKLALKVAADTEFYFENVRVGTLNAIVGGDKYAGKAELILPFNSTINEANFNIGINGSVNLRGAKVLKMQSTVANTKVVTSN